MDLPFEHDMMFEAYKRWCRWCDRAFGSSNNDQWITFDAFLGDTVEWKAAVIWLKPHAAVKIKMIMSPHHNALLQAWYIKQGILDFAS